MVVDTSALVAILTEEAGYDDYLDAIAKDKTRYLSAVNYVETSMVLLRKARKSISFQSTEITPRSPAMRSGALARDAIPLA